MLYGKRVVGALVVATIIAFVLAIGALVTGQSWLEAPSFIFDIPAGNLLAWFIVFSPSLWAWMSLRGSRLSRPAIILFGCGASWLPVTMLLAGNISLNYSGTWRLIASLIYTGISIFGPLVLILGRWVMRKGGTR